jgi:hypothetical protein
VLFVVLLRPKLEVGQLLDGQELVASDFVKQSNCEARPNVLHLNLKNGFD